MKPNFLRLRKQFFSEEMELRVKIFNVLAMAGVVNCVLMVALGLTIGRFDILVDRGYRGSSSLY